MLEGESIGPFIAWHGISLALSLSLSLSLTLSLLGLCKVSVCFII